MRRAQWQLLGLAVGVAVGAAALLGDGATIERLVAASKLGRLTPYAQPPLGQNARAALALALVVLGLAVGWILGQVAGTNPDRDDADEPGTYAAADSASYLAPRAPAHIELPSLDALSSRTLADTEPASSALASAPEPIVEAASPPPPVPASESQPETVRVREPLASIAEPRERIASPERTVTSGHHHGEKAGPDSTPALARIEAIVSDLARHGPHALDPRFDAIEARLQQIAQQLVELAALGRAQQRTPAAASTPPRDARPPADPAQRRALAQTARELRARLGDAELA